MSANADGEKADEAKETTDDRPNCKLCGQKYDIDKAPMMEDKVPIPAALAKLISSEQAAADEKIADVERARQKRTKLIRAFAKSMGQRFRMSLDVEEDPRNDKHMNELFFYDPTDIDRKSKIYLGVKITKDQQEELSDASWEMGDAIQALEEADNSYKEVLRNIANELGWSYRPLMLDKGNFIAPDLLDNVRKQTEEKVKKEQEKKCKR